MGSAAPSFVAAAVRSRAVAPFGRGGQGRGEDEDNRGSSTKSHSETESTVQESCVAAYQKAKHCEQVPF